jgi:hypothetical protein
MRDCKEKVMASHTLRLIYDGLDAGKHKMPTSLVKQFTAGAQEFLGAHAYFFTEGRIQENVNDRSPFFHIHDMRRRQESWEAIFAVDLPNVATECLFPNSCDVSSSAPLTLRGGAPF